MLKKETQEQIAKLLKVKPEDLAAALASPEEQEVAIPEGLTVLTSDELKSRDENTKRTGYNEGKVAGVEIAVKDVQKELGLEIETKSVKALVEAHGKKILEDAKITPDKKVKEQEEIIQKLQSNIQVLEGDKTALQNSISGMAMDKKIQSYIPKNLISALSLEDALLLVKQTHEFVEEDGKMVVKQNGQVVRDPVSQNPLSPEEVIKRHATEKKWLDETQPGKNGRAGSSDAGSGGGDTYTKLSEIEAKWKADGKNTQGGEFKAAVAAAQKANPAFDLDA